MTEQAAIPDSMKKIPMHVVVHSFLTPKGRRSIFSKKCSNLPFLAQEVKTKQKKLFLES
jgi:hypothetical protein